MPFLMLMVVWWFAVMAGAAEIAAAKPACRPDACTPRPPQACFPKPKEETPPCT